MLVFFYLTLCLLVAYLARRRGMNFLAFLLLSIIVTPLITLIVLLVVAGADAGDSRPGMPVAQVTCPRCNHAMKHLKDVEYCAHCGERV